MTALMLNCRMSQPDVCVINRKESATQEIIARSIASLSWHSSMLLPNSWATRTAMVAKTKIHFFHMFHFFPASLRSRIS